MRYQELANLTGWKINTLRKLAADGVLKPISGKFTEDEVNRLMSPEFVDLWISFCTTGNSCSQRIRMTPQFIIDKLRPSNDLIQSFYLHANRLKCIPTQCPVCSRPAGRFKSFSAGFQPACCSNTCAGKLRAQKYVNVSSREEVKEKKRNTFLTKYHATSPMTGELREKTLQTFNKKYGGWPTFSKQISENISISLRKNAVLKLAVPDEFEPRFSESDYLKEGRSRYQFFHKKCANVFNHWVPFTTLNCSFCDGGRSSLERRVASGIKHQNIEMGALVKIDGKKLFPDIKIDDLIIEIDGNYWHSELRGGDKRKTHKRVKLLRDNGYRVMVFFEDEVATKLPIVHSMINAKLGIFSSVLHARKCQVEAIDSKTARMFLDENHIQGYANSSIHLGLFYSGQLIGVATASKRRYGTGGFELVRLAFARDTAVSGGTDKILKHLKQLTPNLVSYSDNRFGTGDVYARLGFKLASNNRESYFYLHTKNYLKRLNRVQFQKHKLGKILEQFDSTKSEWENLKQNGYDRIWDCGSRTWAL